MSTFSDRLFGGLCAFAMLTLTGCPGFFNSLVNIVAGEVGVLPVSIQLTVISSSPRSGDLVITWSGDLIGDPGFASGGGLGFQGGAQGGATTIADTPHLFQNLESANQFRLDARSGLQVGYWTLRAAMGSDNPVECNGIVEVFSGSDATYAFTLDEATGNCTGSVGVDFAGRNDVAIAAIESSSDHENDLLVPGDPSIRIGVSVRNVGSDQADSVDVEMVGVHLRVPPTDYPLALFSPQVKQTPDPLPPNVTSQPLEFAWDTTGLPNGDYELTFRAVPIPGEIATDANSGETIIDNTPNNRWTEVFELKTPRDVGILAIAIDPPEPLRLDPDPTVTGTLDAVVRVLVQNTGEVEEVVELLVDPNPGGVGAAQTLTLGAGAITEVAFVWDTTQLPAQHFDDFTDRSHAYTVGFALGGSAADENPTNNQRALDVVVRRDRDRDGIADENDKCLQVQIAALPIVGQIDSDGDGIGNYCDGDYNQDNVVDFAGDFAILSGASGSVVGEPLYSPVLDANSDGIINAFDLYNVQKYFDQPTALSGLACACARKKTTTGYQHPTNPALDFVGDNPACVNGDELPAPCRRSFPVIVPN